MIKTIQICDKCGKEIDHRNSSITIKYDDGTFMTTSGIHLCKECYKEFMKIYLWK